MSAASNCSVWITTLPNTPSITASFLATVGVVLYDPSDHCHHVVSFSSGFNVSQFCCLSPLQCRPAHNFAIF